MTFAPTYDLMDNQVSATDGKRPSPVQMLMIKLAMARKKNMYPAKGDGFMTTGTHADSDSEGDGTSTTTSPGSTPGQQ
jgi:hypothetical protein